MKMLYRIILFMLLWNISIVMISATGFFGDAVFYGDVFTRMDSTDPNVVLTQFTNESTIKIMGFEITLTSAGILAGSIGVGLAIGFVSGSIAPIALCIVIGLFITMFNESKQLLAKVFNQAPLGSNPALVYIVLMIGLGVLFLFLLEVADIASGQRSSE